MANEDKLNHDKDRGAKADRLLADEMLTGAFADLRDSYIEAWRTSTARDTDGRERLWQAVQIVGKVEEHLKATAASGKLAQRELDDLARLGERRKIFGVV